MIEDQTSQQSVAVVGASRARHKFGNKAVRAYLDRGFRVVPINPRGGEIEGCAVSRSLDELPVESVDLVSLYVPPNVAIELLDSIARLRPREVWLNPGSESEELIARANELGLPIVRACSILSLGKFPADY